MNLILSGVLVPLGAGDAVLDGGCPRQTPVAAESVVMRPRFVVSAEGGGGKEERVGMELRVEERQRKHSPLP